MMFISLKVYQEIKVPSEICFLLSFLLSQLIDVGQIPSQTIVI